MTVSPIFSNSAKFWMFCIRMTTTERVIQPVNIDFSFSILTYGIIFLNALIFYISLWHQNNNTFDNGNTHKKGNIAC